MKRNIVDLQVTVKLPAYLDAQDASDMLNELIGEGMFAAQNIAEETSDPDIRAAAQRVLCADYSLNGVSIVGTEGTDLECRVDVDEAIYVGDEEDGVYYQVFKEDDDNYYTSAIVDCNTGGFCDGLVTADGPYACYNDAAVAGLNMAADWCANNDVDFGDDYDQLRRMLGQ